MVLFMTAPGLLNSSAVDGSEMVKSDRRGLILTKPNQTGQGPGEGRVGASTSLFSSKMARGDMQSKHAVSRAVGNALFRRCFRSLF